MELYRPITVEDGDRIKHILRKYQNDLSSHAFPSLWLWQKEMKLTSYVQDDFFAIREGEDSDNSYFFPCGKEENIRTFLMEKEKGTKLHYIPAWGKSFLKKEFPDEWNLTRAEYADEYLYDIAGHMQLHGGTYANMRTQVHRVEKNFHPETAVLTEENRQDALRIIRAWEHGEHRFTGHSIRDDEVDEWAVLFAEELEVTGVIVYLDGKPMAVAAGFPLSDTTFDLAVSKCSENLQGVSYYAKRELLKYVQDTYLYMNMEEDLGIPGLRTMKTALRPIAKNEMWEAVKL